MKNCKKNLLKSKNGITLIALVITIIVLLILAGITISMLTGDNSILKRTSDAKEITGVKQITEELQLAINGLAIDYHSTDSSSGTFRNYIFSTDAGKGQEKLKAELGADNLSFDTSNYKITYKGIVFDIAEDGTATNAETGSVVNNSEDIDWDAIKSTAKKHPEQDKNNDIGIDANGNIVNLDLWKYTYHPAQGGIWLGPEEGGDYSYMNINEGNCYLPFTDEWNSYAGNKEHVEKVNIVCPKYIKIDGADDFYEVKILNGGAFSSCQGLKSVVLPDTLIYIGYEAFYNSKQLETVIVPTGTESVGDKAFKECTNLSNIQIPNTVTYIGVEAFSNCANIENISLPNSVTNIGNNAFNGCTKLKHISCPVGVLDEHDSWPPSIETFDITGGTLIGQREFNNCINLKRLNIPSTVTRIDEGTFYNCTELSSITIPSSVNGIDSGAFNGCSKLVHISSPVGFEYNSWPSTIETFEITGGTQIREYEFSSCNKLTSITIPNTITSIAQNAFGNLTSVKLDSSAIVSEIYGGEFDFNSYFGYEIQNIYIKSNIYNSSKTTVSYGDGSDVATFTFNEIVDGYAKYVKTDDTDGSDGSDS